MIKKSVIKELNNILSQTISKHQSKLSKTQINNINKIIKLFTQYKTPLLCNSTKTAICNGNLYIFGIDFSPFIIDKNIQILNILDNKIKENNQKEYYNIEFYEDIKVDNKIIKIYKYNNEFAGINKKYYDICSKIVNSNDLLYDGKEGFILKNNLITTYIMKIEVNYNVENNSEYN